jgi:hypothetical protein
MGGDGGNPVPWHRATSRREEGYGEEGAVARSWSGGARLMGW